VEGGTVDGNKQREQGNGVVEEQRASARVEEPRPVEGRRFLDAAKRVAEKNAEALRLLAER
jgi:hypothetical protein